MVTEQNVETVIHIFKNVRTNAKGLLKDLLGCTDKQFRQIEANYNFNGYSHLLKPKKKKPRLGVYVKALKMGGVEINKEAKSIALPERELTEEETQAVEKLTGAGYLLQKGIY